MKRTRLSLTKPSRLPTQLLIHTLSFLSLPEAALAQRTCKDWNVPSLRVPTVELSIKQTRAMCRDDARCDKWAAGTQTLILGDGGGARQFPLFRRLVDLQVTNLQLSTETWQTLLTSCPLLVRINILNYAVGVKQMMSKVSDWNASGLIRRPWQRVALSLRAVPMEDATAVWLLFANEQLQHFEWQTGYRTMVSEERLRAFCALCPNLTYFSAMANFVHFAQQPALRVIADAWPSLRQLRLETPHRSPHCETLDLAVFLYRKWPFLIRFPPREFDMNEPAQRIDTRSDELPRDQLRELDFLHDLNIDGPRLMSLLRTSTKWQDVRITGSLVAPLPGRDVLNWFSTCACVQLTTLQLEIVKGEELSDDVMQAFASKLPLLQRVMLGSTPRRFASSTSNLSKATLATWATHPTLQSVLFRFAILTQLSARDIGELRRVCRVPMFLVYASRPTELALSGRNEGLFLGVEL